jgi:antitoxin HicB
MENGMRFPTNLEPQEEVGFVVTFPYIPEAITQGENKIDALARAQDALESALEFYFEGAESVPEPSNVTPGQEYVELPASVSAKVLLLNEMVRQAVRPADLARRLDTTPQEVNRLTNLRHATKIDRIAGALKVLGKTLEIRIL